MPAHQDARREIARVARRADVDAPGRCAALSYAGSDSRPEAIGDIAADPPGLVVTTPLVLHPTAQICGLFDGLLLVDPGPVSATWWRPEPDLDPGEATRRMRVGVAR